MEAVLSNFIGTEVRHGPRKKEKSKSELGFHFLSRMAKRYGSKVPLAIHYLQNG
jgi:hypothetical protein